MKPLSVLFIGGSGVISSACVELAVATGHRVAVLNRGVSSVRPLPAAVDLLRADVHDRRAVEAALQGSTFDAVVDFLGFDADHARAAIEFFAGRTSQYVFISSASAYQTPPARLPVLESTPLRNPFWAYSRNKIAAEDVLVAAYRESGFPMTIVRPSHTYDRTSVPFRGGWTVLGRIRAGRPIVVHGDGTSLWTLTHATDFARGLVPLLGNSRAIGEAFHLTSDDVLSWNQIADIFGTALGVAPRIVHRTSDAIAAVDAEWGDSLLGDKAHSMVFDNSKLKSFVPGFVATVPFERGAAEIVDWFDADPARRQVDPEHDALMDRLVDTQQ